MMTLSWRRLLKRFSRPFGSDRRHGPSRWRNRLSRPPQLERLEDRTLLSTSIPLNSTSWTDIGPAPITGGQVPGGGNVSGRVNGLATDPSNVNVIYAATSGGGVWKTTDGGNSWTALTDNLTDSSGNPIPEFMGAIAVAPSNSQVVYAGTGEANNPFPFSQSAADSFSGEGILVSTDGGSTWTLTAQGPLQHLAVARIAVDPQDPNTAYAAVSNSCNNVNPAGSTGIYKTTDGGTTWTNMTAADGLDSSDPWCDVVIDPTTTGNSAVLFAAVGNIQGASQNGVYKSTDGGLTWTLVGGGSPTGTSIGRISLAIAHPSGAANATLYESIADNGSNSFSLFALERSTNSGASWTDITANLNGDDYLSGQGFFDNVIEINPNNPNMVFAAGVLQNQGFGFGFSGGGIVESQDGGATWTDGTNHPDINTGTSGDNGPHTDYHALAFDANGRLVVGNDGGVWRLDQNDLTTPNIAWTDLNSNLETILFTGVALDPSNVNLVYGGSQDNGTEKFNDNRQWSLSDGGDGGFVRVDPVNPQVVYHTFFSTFIERSNDGGSTWTDISGGIDPFGTDASNFYVPYVMDPNNHSRLLLGTDRLYVTNDGGGSSGDWTALGNAPSAGTPINAIAIDPTNSNHIFVAAGAHLYVTGNAGQSWTDVTPFGVTNDIRSVTVDSANSELVFCVTDGFTGSSNGHVFWSFAGGNAGTWQDIGGTTFPDVSAASVLYVPSIGTLLVGTDVGVYGALSINGNIPATVWTRFGDAMPNARVTDLETATINGTPIVAAATHGRGVWEITAPAPASADLSITMTGPANVTAGGKATYTITLTNNGPDDALGVTLTDTLPTAAQFVSIVSENPARPWGFAVQGHTLIGAANGGANLAPGDSDSFILVLSCPNGTPTGTDFSNTVSTTDTTPDPNLNNNSFTLKGTVGAATADLSVSETGPAGISAGQTAEYTITLTNNGPDSASGVVLTDALSGAFGRASIAVVASNPDNFTFSFPSAGMFVMTATGDIASGNQDIFIVTVSTSSSTASGSTLTDAASVVSTSSDPNSGNNSFSVTTNIVTSADLSVTKTGPATATAGTQATYTITLTNDGPSDAQSVQLTDTLPAGAGYVSFNPNVNNPDNFQITPGSGVITATATSMASGHTDVFTVVVNVGSNLSSGAPFDNTVTVSSNTSDPTLTDNTSTVNGTVAVVADLSVTKAGPASITAGTNATYTLSFTNAGPSPAANLVLTDTIPTGAVVISMTASPSNPDSFTAGGSGNVLTETANAVVASGHTDSFILVLNAPLTLPDGTDFSDTASVSSSATDPTPADNISTVTGTVIQPADLSVTKVGPSLVTAGTNATYTITLANKGPFAAQSLVLSDTMPLGALLQSVTPDVTNPDHFTQSTLGNTFTETATAPVASGNQDVFVVVIRAPSSMSAGADFSDTASVTSTNTDLNLNNNSSTVNGSIVTSADLSLTKVGPANVTAGTTATYTITLTNRGPSDAQNVQLTDALPAGGTYISFTPGVSNPDSFNFALSGNTLTGTATGAVTALGTDTFVLLVAAPSSLASGANFSDTASVSSSTNDPTSTDNTSTVTGSIVTSADLVSFVKVGPASVTAGTRATYTIDLVNQGPSDAQNVVLTDTLPSAGVLVSFTPDPANLDTFNFSRVGNVVTEQAASVGARHLDSFTVILSAPSGLIAGTDFSDTAAITSDTPDPTGQVHTSTVKTTIVTSADLSVTQTGPAQVTAGTMATYTVSLTNKGPSDAQNVVLTDVFPGSGTLISITPGAANADQFIQGRTGNTITETARAAVGSGHVDTFVLLVAAASSLAPSTPFSNTAFVQSTTPDPSSANNRSTITGSIVTSADLSVNMVGPARVTAGTNATYTISLTNSGPSDAQNVLLTESPPIDQALSFTPNSGNPDSFSPTFIPPSVNVALQAVTVGAGHTDTFVLIIHAPSSMAAGASFNTTVNVSSNTTDPIPANDSATVSGSVITSAELSVAKIGPVTVLAGTRATYTLVLTNSGPSDAQSVVFSDALPAGAVLLSVTPGTGNRDTFTQGFAGNKLTESTTTLTAGDTDTFVLVVAAPGNLPGGTDFSDTATVTSTTTDPVRINNSFTLIGSIVVAADLALSQSGPATAAEDGLLTYTLSVVNTGPSDAQNVVLTELLPANLVLVAANPSQGTLIQAGGTVTFTLGKLAGGAAATATIVAQAKEDGATAVLASVLSNTVDPNGYNNSAATITNVLEGALGLSVFDQNATEFTALGPVTVASFTHAGALEPGTNFSATINWGDGTTSAGTVVPAGATYLVQGTHSYGPDGNYAITVTVAEDGVSASGGATATVGEAALPAGVSSSSLTQSITETLEHAFAQQPTATQVNALASSLTLAELALAASMAKNGGDAFSAFLASEFVVPFEFSFLASNLAQNGTSLDAAVSEMELLFLMQSVMGNGG